MHKKGAWLNRKNTAASRHDQRQHHGVEMISICLSDGPKTIAEIERHFFELPRRFGMFIEVVDQDSIERGHLSDSLDADIEEMITEGLVVRNGKKHQLTDKGRAHAQTRLTGLTKFGDIVRNFLIPQTAAKVSLGIHFLLAAIKLPAGIISSSVGLMNDAIDTLLDGFSSVLVLLGLRFNKERVVNCILVLFMLVTGSFTFFKAVQRIFRPVYPQVDWFTFTAAIISALFCAGLGIYQRYIGLRSGNFSLIAQSVDSRNHVIVALSVTAGLISSLLNFPLLDTLVGLAVAALILKSAVELAIDIAKNFREESGDLSRYKSSVTERYAKFRQNQLRNWLLFLIEKEGQITTSMLNAYAVEMLDFSSNPALRSVGLNQQIYNIKDITKELNALSTNGWITGKESLSLTADGKEHLAKSYRQSYQLKHREF